MYVEKRISLMENILLDIKMNQEQMPTRILPSMPPSVTFQELAHIMKPHEHEHEHEDQHQHQQQQQEQQQEQQMQQQQQQQQQEQQQQQQQQQNNQVESLYTTMLDEAHKSIEIQHIEIESHPTIQKVRINYESMTKDELIEVAKKKGLRTGNKPGREKLLQIIRKSEELIEEAVPSNEEA